MNLQASLCSFANTPQPLLKSPTCTLKVWLLGSKRKIVDFLSKIATTKMEFASLAAGALGSFLQGGNGWTKLDTPEEQKAGRAQKRLQRAKEHTAFRFLDLPPELRNKIYAELLTLTEKEGSYQRFCWPQILAASKQINDEAGKMLYAENVINIDIISQFDVIGRNPQLGYMQRCARVLSLDDRMYLRDLMRLHSCSNVRWPVFLRNVRHLRLNIKIAYAGDPTGFSGDFLDRAYTAVELMLDSLRLFLGTGHSIEACEVNVKIERPPLRSRDKLLKKTLWPLAMLSAATPAVFKFEFTGLSKEVVNHLQEIIQQYVRAPMSSFHYAVLFSGLSAISLNKKDTNTVNEGYLVRAVGRKLKQTRRFVRGLDQRLLAMANSAEAK